MKQFWNERYSQSEFAYGTAPNAFVKQCLEHLPKGKILFPADGEGRNSVFAAEQGWEAHAFDFSESGKQKAEQLAALRGVNIYYTIQAFLKESYTAHEFDAIGLTFVHFEPEIKSAMHRRLDGYLRVGGTIILEAFSKEHRALSLRNPALGGPPDENFMYTIDQIERDFPHYEIQELRQVMTHLDEGYGHVGESSVVRFVGKKLRDNA